MPKTKETVMLERSLDAISRDKREYGCEEVTIGFRSKGHGDEIVDYMTMDSENVFRCYELKVTLADLKTDNKKSFYGDYNYLVVSKALYAKNPVWSNYIPPYVGILVGKDLAVKRQAKKKEIDQETREMLKDSLLRSVFWKYENYKDASDLSVIRDMQKAMKNLEEETALKLRESERMTWTYQDYEHWYRINHDDPSFTLEAAAKKERAEVDARKKKLLVWKADGDSLICPVCSKEVHEAGYRYCPYCGTDLKEN